jgi:diguanylate cyclase (GGDEF)-like protein
MSSDSPLPDPADSDALLARASALRGDPAAMRFRQEVGETREAIKLGGLFYFIGWLMVLVSADALARTPLWTLVVAAVFLVLAVVRFVLPTPDDVDPARLAVHLRRIWATTLSTAVLWGTAAGIVVGDARFGTGRYVAIFATVAYATAFAQTFNMRLWPAGAGIALAYVPPMVVLWFAAGTRALAGSMAIYVVYVALALLRGHSDYQRRLDVDQELREQRDRYERQSRRDWLTGLANRRRFNAAFSQAWREALDRGTPLALLLFDLDHFKTVNDRHGHSVGDRCLAAFAERLRGAFGGLGELAARIGGEEFAVILTGTAALAAYDRAEAFRAALAAQPLAIGDIDLPLTVSIGVGIEVRGEHRQPDDLYRAIDQALYRAKEEGRDRVCQIAHGPRAALATS